MQQQKNCNNICKQISVIIITNKKKKKYKQHVNKEVYIYRNIEKAKSFAFKSTHQTVAPAI